MKAKERSLRISALSDHLSETVFEIVPIDNRHRDHVTRSIAPQARPLAVGAHSAGRRRQAKRRTDGKVFHMSPKSLQSEWKL